MQIDGQDTAIDNKLEMIIADYLQQAFLGIQPDRRQLLASNPELRLELIEFFDHHDWMLGISMGRSSLSERGTEETVAGNQTVSVGSGSESKSASRPATAIRFTQFTDYEILEEIGRGGMGVIYQARQISLKRIVALKMIRASHLASQADVDRFRVEAQLAAKLDHPGIVPIYEVGESEGQHFFSMGYVDGLSLADLLSKVQVLQPRTASELVRRVAIAISYAHNCGVVHRDLKPANILLAASHGKGGVSIHCEGADQEWEPRVVDFGLAKSLESDSELTGTGQILGTPSYMAPEQANCRDSEITNATDVYALGAVLYCLLTGRPPFRAANTLETIQQVIHEEPVPVRQLNSAVPRDLETICLKCLNKSPNRRYASAMDLANDLQSYREGKPVLARPSSRAERVWKWIKRRPTAATLVVVGLIAALATVGLCVNYYHQGIRERLLYAMRTVSTFQLWSNRDLNQAQNLLSSSPAHLRGWEWHYLNQLCDVGNIYTFDGNGADVQVHQSLYKSVGIDVDIDPTGRYLASAVGNNLIVVWSLADRSIVARLAGHTMKVQSLCFDRTGQYLASTARDGTAYLWDASDWSLIKTWSAGSDSINGLAFHPSSQTLFTAGADKRLKAWPVHELLSQSVWEPNQTAEMSQWGEPRCLACSPDGTHLLISHESGHVTQWELGGQLISTASLSVSEQDLLSVCLHPDGKLFVASGENGKIYVWNLEQRREQCVCEGHQGGVIGLTFSADGKQFLSTGAHDKLLRVWDCNTGRLKCETEAAEQRGKTRDFGQVIFHPHGHFAAVASDDNRVRIFSIGGSQECETLSAHDMAVRCLALNSTQQLFSGSMNGIIKVHQLSSGTCLQEFAAHDKPISALAIQRQGNLLASASDRTLKLWDFTSGKLLWERSQHKAVINGLAYVADGKQLISVGHDGCILLWQTSTGEVLQELIYTSNENNPSPIASIAIAPNSSKVAIGCWDGSVAIYGFDGTQLKSRPRILKAHTREVLSLAYSPDGEYLASGDRDGIVWLWHSGRATRRLEETATHASHSGPVTGLAFGSRNRILSTGWDSTLNVWDVQTGLLTLTLSGRHGRTYGLVADDSTGIVAGANHDGTINIWGKRSNVY